MSHTCPGCHHQFEANALAGILCCPRCARNFDAQQDVTAEHDTAETDHWSAATGKKVDGYQLVRQIGQGGMAEVWLAKSNASKPTASKDEQVVIKILLPHVASNEHICKRFEREIESLKRFEHPNIIPICDHGESNGRPYYVTPVHAKMSLRQIIDGLRGKTIKLDLIHRIASDCLAALAHAHEQHIIHRDIKPENILALDDNSYAVGDFGIAQMHSTHDGETLTMLTNTSVVLGTYSYMAPEQSRGSRDIDARADLYALGVVLYECISGHLPEGRFEDPEQFLKHWPQEKQKHWNDFILCLLERDPNKRYRNAETALDVLLAPDQATGHKSKAEKKKHSKKPANTVDLIDYPHGHQLYRDSTHGWIGGVCSGLGSWSGIDPGWLRLAFCVGIVSSAGILFLLYLGIVLLLPNCPDTYYVPKPLNSNLPQRGNGWFLGVCEMMGKNSATPGTWRFIFFILCFFSSFVALVPYLAIGIIFPTQKSRRKTQRHLNKHHARAAQHGSTQDPEISGSLWPSFLSAVPACTGLGFSSYYCYTYDQLVMAAICASICLYFISQLHTRAPMTPVNFMGIASGLVIGGGSLLACLILIQFDVLNWSFSGNEMPLYIIAGLSLFHAVLWSLMRGYYGALALLLGLFPGAALLVMHCMQDGQFSINMFDPTPLPAVFTLVLFGLLWMVSARICQTMLRWLINPTEGNSRQYNLSASIICIGILCSAVFAFLFLFSSSSRQVTIDTQPSVRTLLQP